MSIKEITNNLRGLDVNSKTEKKNKLTYLSWSWAWDEVLKVYPSATYEIVKFENNLPYVFDPITGFMVFTKVTIEGITREMWLPVMDGANKSMKDKPYTYKVKDYYESKKQGKDIYKEKRVEAATMFDINKTIMRCLTKNLAMFGLGLYIYSGEDLPDNKVLTDERFKNALESIKSGKTDVSVLDNFILTESQAKEVESIK